MFSHGTLYQICYLLIIEWRQYYQRFVTRRGGTTTSTFSTLQEKSRLHFAKEIPTSWKVGSWMYTGIIALAFLAGLFRIDAMPFYSWVLYNDHPSDPVVANPFVQETVQYGARQCLREPPLNPLCQHLGNTRVRCSCKAVCGFVRNSMFLGKRFSHHFFSIIVNSSRKWSIDHVSQQSLNIKTAHPVPLVYTITGDGCCVTRLSLQMSALNSIWTL